MTKIILFLFLSITLLSCNKDKTIHIYSEDRQNSLTVFEKDTLRYVTPGIASKIPNSNYAKFDISGIDKLGDGLWICWLKNGGWDFTIHKATLISNDLDTSKYHIQTSLPTDSRGIPTERKYRQKDCAVFDFYMMELSPKKGAVVEIE